MISNLSLKTWHSKTLQTTVILNSFLGGWLTHTKMFAISDNIHLFNIFEQSSLQYGYQYVHNTDQDVINVGTRR